MKTIKFLFLGVIACFCMALQTPFKYGKITDSELVVRVDKIDVSQENAKDGKITLSIEGGVPPYSINVYSTEINHKKYIGKDLKLDHLTSGSYLFIIQDNNKDIIQQSVELSIRK